MNNLTGCNTHNPLTPGNTSEEIAEGFDKFFSNKITKIQQSFTRTSQYHPIEETNMAKLTSFRSLTDDEVKREIMSMKNKNCELDNISTLTLKEIITVCLPSITHIVNVSLTRGDFITEWKLAIVKPFLKKSGSKPLHRNYRPVSNLCFLSNLVEQCMLWQFLDHCTQNNLIPDFQSAYHETYSTKSSLLNLTNDLLWGCENQNITSTVILDLSTAFDTVDHDILLTMLHDHFGIQDTALNWFKNYHRPWFFKVAVDSTHSSPRELKYEVPQGSCSGANLFTCYCSLIEDQIDNSITLTAFADDHSIHNNFKAGDKEQEHKVKTDLEKTFTHLKQWMDMMCLKVNPDKTEYILFGSQQQLKKTSQESLNAQGDLIAVSKVVRYLGGFLDKNLNFKRHIKEKTKKAMANIIKIHAIWKYLTVQSCTTLVLMLCITHLDYANAMLYGLPSITLRKYQTIQNICAKLVLNKNRYSSSLVTLKKLHWLPIQQRIEHKILMTTFKCITGITPKYLWDLISIENNTWDNMQSNNTGIILHTPKVKYQTFAAWSLMYTAPTLWSQLPKHIRDSPNLNIFKKRLKTHLFCQTFN